MHVWCVFCGIVLLVRVSVPIEQKMYDQVMRYSASRHIDMKGVFDSNSFKRSVLAFKMLTSVHMQRSYLQAPGVGLQCQRKIGGNGSICLEDVAPV